MGVWGQRGGERELGELAGGPVAKSSSDVLFRGMGVLFMGMLREVERERDKQSFFVQP